MLDRSGKDNMETVWTDPNNGIEYLIEFGVATALDGYGATMPVVQEILSICPDVENQPCVDLKSGTDRAWFEMHEGEIFDACRKRLAESEREEE